MQLLIVWLLCLSALWWHDAWRAIHDWRYLGDARTRAMRKRIGDWLDGRDVGFIDLISTPTQE
jgi:hypothetical protein